MKMTTAWVVATLLLAPAIALAAGEPVDLPEPGTLALLAIGVAGLAFSRRRKS
jgi:PEP-CTERM motif